MAHWCGSVGIMAAYRISKTGVLPPATTPTPPHHPSHSTIHPTPSISYTDIGKEWQNNHEIQPSLIYKVILLYR